MDSLRDGATKVDEIKKKIKEKESELFPLKMKIPIVHKKNVEYSNMFVETEKSIEAYYQENKKVKIILFRLLQE